MKYSEAKKMLEFAGFKIARQGKGSHVIFEKNNKRIVISDSQELSPGMAGKVRSACNKKE